MSDNENENENANTTADANAVESVSADASSNTDVSAVAETDEVVEETTVEETVAEAETPTATVPAATVPAATVPAATVPAATVPAEEPTVFDGPTVFDEPSADVASAGESSTAEAAAVTVVDEAVAAETVAAEQTVAQAAPAEQPTVLQQPQPMQLEQPQWQQPQTEQATQAVPPQAYPSPYPSPYPQQQPQQQQPQPAYASPQQYPQQLPQPQPGYQGYPSPGASGVYQGAYPPPAAPAAPARPAGPPPLTAPDFAGAVFDGVRALGAGFLAIVLGLVITVYGGLSSANLHIPFTEVLRVSAWTVGTSLGTPVTASYSSSVDDGSGVSATGTATITVRLTLWLITIIVLYLLYRFAKHRERLLPSRSLGQIFARALVTGLAVSVILLITALVSRGTILPDSSSSNLDQQRYGLSPGFVFLGPLLLALAVGVIGRLAVWIHAATTSDPRAERLRRQTSLWAPAARTAWLQMKVMGTLIGLGLAGYAVNEVFQNQSTGSYRVAIIVGILLLLPNFAVLGTLAGFGVTIYLGANASALLSASSGGSSDTGSAGLGFFGNTHPMPWGLWLLLLAVVVGTCTPMYLGKNSTRFAVRKEDFALNGAWRSVLIGAVTALAVVLVGEISVGISGGSSFGGSVSYSASLGPSLIASMGLTAVWFLLAYVFVSFSLGHRLQPGTISGYGPAQQQPYPGQSYAGQPYPGQPNDVYPQPGAPGALGTPGYASVPPQGSGVYPTPGSGGHPSQGSGVYPQQPVPPGYPQPVPQQQYPAGYPSPQQPVPQQPGPDAATAATAVTAEAVEAVEELGTFGDAETDGAGPNAAPAAEQPTVAAFPAAALNESGSGPVVSAPIVDNGGSGTATVPFADPGTAPLTVPLTQGPGVPDPGAPAPAQFDSSGTVQIGAARQPAPTAEIPVAEPFQPHYGQFPQPDYLGQSAAGQPVYQQPYGQPPYQGQWPAGQQPPAPARKGFRPQLVIPLVIAILAGGGFLAYHYLSGNSLNGPESAVSAYFGDLASGDAKDAAALAEEPSSSSDTPVVDAATIANAANRPKDFSIVSSNTATGSLLNTLKQAGFAGSDPTLVVVKYTLQGKSLTDTYLALQNTQTGKWILGEPYMTVQVTGGWSSSATVDGVSFDESKTIDVFPGVHVFGDPSNPDFSSESTSPVPTDQNEGSITIAGYSSGSVALPTASLNSAGQQAVQSAYSSALNDCATQAESGSGDCGISDTYNGYTCNSVTWTITTVGQAQVDLSSQNSDGSYNLSATGSVASESGDYYDYSYTDQTFSNQTQDLTDSGTVVFNSDGSATVTLQQ